VRVSLGGVGSFGPQSACVEGGLELFGEDWTRERPDLTVGLEAKTRLQVRDLLYERWSESQVRIGETGERSPQERKNVAREPIIVQNSEFDIFRC
jgi:hypothetical protein